MKQIEDTLKEYNNHEDAEVRQFISFIRDKFRNTYVLEFYDELLKHIATTPDIRTQASTVLTNKIPQQILEKYAVLLSTPEKKVRLLNFLNEYPENIIVLLFNEDYQKKCIKRIVENIAQQFQEELRDEEIIQWIYYRNVPPPQFEENKKLKKIEIKRSNELIKKQDKIVYIDKLTRIDLVKKRLQILNINGEVIEDFKIAGETGGYMDYFVKYLKIINSGKKVLFEEFKSKFLNLKYLLVNLDDIMDTIGNGDCFDDIITDLLMSNIDLEYMFDHYKDYEEYIADLVAKIRYLKYKYNLDERLRRLLIEGISVNRFGEFCERIKAGVLKDKLDDAQLFELYKQISDKGGQKFNLDLSLKYIERIQYQKQFMQIINLAEPKKLVPLLRNMILNKESFAEFFEEYKGLKKQPELPREVVRDSKGRLQLRGTSYFAVQYDVNYNATKSKIVFSNGKVLYIDKIHLKSKYHRVFKDVMKKEILCAKLAKQFKLSNRKYDVALYDGDDALTEEEYDEDGNLITGDKILKDKNEMDVNNILQQTEDYLKENQISPSDIENLKIEFLKMVLFDKFVNQSSRSNNDWAIIISKRNAKFAPLFNNGNAFTQPTSNQSKEVADAIKESKDMVNKLNNKNRDFIMSIKGESSLNAFLNEFFDKYPGLQAFIKSNIHLINLNKAAYEIYREKGIYINISNYIPQFLENTKIVQDFIRERELKTMQKTTPNQFEKEISDTNSNGENNS